VANLQSTIDLIFNGVDNASEVAKQVSGSLGDLASSAEDISAPFADLAGKVAVVQTAMTALAGVIGALAFNESAKFQASLSDLQKQMDASEGSAADFGQRLESLALKYGQNNNELVKSAADFKAAGYDIDTSIKLVKSSMDLAIAGGVETSAAVDVMNRSLAGFQVPASEVAREAQHPPTSPNPALASWQSDSPTCHPSPNKPGCPSKKPSRCSRKWWTCSAPARKPPMD